MKRGITNGPPLRSYISPLACGINQRDSFRHMNEVLLTLAVGAAAALIGGSIGSWWGAKHSTPVMIRRLLGVVLAIAGVKLLFP